MAKIYCNKKEDIPEKAHYAIIENSSVYIPGDERSRTCPGHGYPASTEYFIRYIAYLDEDEWRKDIAEKVRQNKTDFKAMKVYPSKINISVNVDID